MGTDDLDAYMKYTLIFLATLVAIAAAQEHDSASGANEALFGTDLIQDLIGDENGKHVDEALDFAPSKTKARTYDFSLADGACQWSKTTTCERQCKLTCGSLLLSEKYVGRCVKYEWNQSTRRCKLIGAKPTRAPTRSPTPPTPTHPPVTIDMSRWHCGLRAGETAGNCKLGDCEWQCKGDARGKGWCKRVHWDAATLTCVLRA